MLRISVQPLPRRPRTLADRAERALLPVLEVLVMPVLVLWLVVFAPVRAGLRGLHRLVKAWRGSRARAQYTDVVSKLLAAGRGERFVLEMPADLAAARGLLPFLRPPGWDRPGGVPPPRRIVHRGGCICESAPTASWDEVPASALVYRLPSSSWQFWHCPAACCSISLKVTSLMEFGTPIPGQPALRVTRTGGDLLMFWTGGTSASYDAAGWAVVFVREEALPGLESPELAAIGGSRFRLAVQDGRLELFVPRRWPEESDAHAILTAVERLTDSPPPPLSNVGSG